MKKNILFGALTALALLTNSCQKEFTPGFAVVIDPESYKQVQTEIDQYLLTVESRGLKPILVIDRWGVPDSIRQQLITLHNAKDYPIEGCVFIGDIPVAMVRDAQHMASAFKMDQDDPRFDRTDYHVPTDRFYDSFDLKWDFMDKDSVNQGYFYYSLRADGAQECKPTIYSARITPRDNDRGEKYEKLRRYMQRVNAADSQQNAMDHVLFFAGHGNLSNSIMARMDTRAEFYDMSPWLTDREKSVSFMDYSQQTDIKPRIMDELQNPVLDYALMQHHGDAAIQYLSVDENNEMINLTTDDFGRFVPQAKVLALDACYNGSFHVKDNIQEAYLFTKGSSSMLVFANSVNSIQDKWANRFFGMFGIGLRAGNIIKLHSFLEYHLFGDPTYAFAASADPGFDVNAAMNNGDDDFWKSQLNNKYAAVQQLAVNRLAENPTNSGVILERYKTSNSGTVRMEALMGLNGINDQNLMECIKLALNDECEMPRRFATIYAGRIGSQEALEALLKLRINNNLSERVEFDFEQALRGFDSIAVISTFDRIFAEYSYNIDKDSVLEARHKEINQTAGKLYFDIRKALVSTTASHSSKMIAIRGIRNNPPHFVVPEVLNYLDNPATEPADSSIQTSTWEALGWFNLSYRAPEIAEHALKVSEDTRFPSSVRKEALKTYNRLK